MRKVLELGRGTLLAKVDTAHAYRNVPVDCQLLWMQWNGWLFVDNLDCVHLQSCFWPLQMRLEWVRGVRWCIHYILQLDLQTLAIGKNIWSLSNVFVLNWNSRLSRKTLRAPRAF